MNASIHIVASEDISKQQNDLDSRHYLAVLGHSQLTEQDPTHASICDDDVVYSPLNDLERRSAWNFTRIGSWRSRYDRLIGPGFGERVGDARFPAIKLTAFNLGMWVPNYRHE